MNFNEKLNFFKNGKQSIKYIAKNYLKNIKMFELNNFIKN